MKIFLEVDDNEFDELFQKIAKKVKLKRVVRGFTQEQLALEIGLV